MKTFKRFLATAGPEEFTLCYGNESVMVGSIVGWDRNIRFTALGAWQHARLLSAVCEIRANHYNTYVKLEGIGAEDIEGFFKMLTGDIGITLTSLNISRSALKAKLSEIERLGELDPLYRKRVLIASQPN